MRFAKTLRILLLLLASALGSAVPGVSRADDRADLQATVAEAKKVVAQIRVARADDPRLYFLETQEQILDGLLTSSYFHSHPADLHWVSRVTRHFMTSLDQALAGHVARRSTNPAENDAQWRQILAGQLGGFWWGSAFADCDRRAHAFHREPWPAPQLDEWFASAYMVAHIDFDLRLSLLAEGVGSDAAFDEVGRLVQTAWDAKSRFPRSLMEFGMQYDPVLRSLDPTARRTKMREQVRAYLAGKGVTDPLQGIPIHGTPEGAAFAGAGGALAP